MEANNTDTIIQCDKRNLCLLRILWFLIQIQVEVIYVDKFTRLELYTICRSHTEEKGGELVLLRV